MSTSVCKELTCDRLVPHVLGGAKDSYMLDIIQKPEISTGAMGQLARKGFSYINSNNSGDMDYVLYLTQVSYVGFEDGIVLV